MRIMRFLPAFLLLAASLPAAAVSLARDNDVSGVSRPGAVVTGAAGTRELADLHAAERRRAQAVASRDIAALRNLISGDYYHVESTGRARTKTEFLQLLTRDESEFRSYETDDIETRMLDNGRAAVITGRFRAELQGAQRMRGRFVRMWVLGPDGWRNTMQQTTEIRPLALQRDARAQQ